MTRQEYPGESAAGGGAGEGWDFAALIERDTDRIFRFLRSWTGDEEMARDLTQDTLLKVGRTWQAGASLLPPRSYVYTTARNLAVSHYRHRRLEARHLEARPPEEIESLAETAQSGPARRLERAELRDALHRALADLPERLRAVLLLSELEGLSYAEIGAVLECSPGTVASRKHHAVRRLRRALGGAYDAL